MSDINPTTSIPYYKAIVGNGNCSEWLTLLHGATQHCGLFSAQVEYFRDKYKLLLVDLPGHGRSSHLPGPYGQVEYASAVLAALDAARVKVTHVWGTHTGTAVALLLARNTPERIASLVLEGPVIPGVSMPYVAYAIDRAKATALTAGMAAANREWFHQCKWFDVIRSNPTACRADTHWEMLAEFSGKPWLDKEVPAGVPEMLDALYQIHQPVLLVNGEHDVPDFLRASDELQARLPNVKRNVVKGGGGFPLWELPEVVNRRVEQFLLAL